MNQLDRYDYAILGALQLDGTLSIADLAGKVGLSSTPCWKRLKRLEEEGYIDKRVAIVNRRKAGLGVTVFVMAGPIAARLGVETLIATECEMQDGRYTGRSTDVPCFREGKVTRLNRWLEETGFSLQDSYFYSDSSGGGGSGCESAGRGPEAWLAGD
eukprot:gene40434-50014_t